MYPEYCVWRKLGIKDIDGIVVGTDLTQEWMLSWWWSYYSKHNSYPVAFVDFGMSEEGRNWCRERGELIPLRVADVFVAEREEVDPSLVKKWEERFGCNFWPSRNAFFKKPLACLQSPFRRTLWLDLDCEVRGSLSNLFALSDPPFGIALHRQRSSEAPYPMYNSGVISFQHGAPLIENWAKLCFEKNHLFRGDQEILAQVIAEQNITIGQISEEVHWLHSYGKNPDVLIYHWTGDGTHLCIRRTFFLTEEKF